MPDHRDVRARIKNGYRTCHPHETIGKLDDHTAHRGPVFEGPLHIFLKEAHRHLSASDASEHELSECGSAHGVELNVLEASGQFIDYHPIGGGSVCNDGHLGVATRHHGRWPAD